MRKIILLLLFLYAFANHTNAQATLPDFTVKNNNEKNSVCWQNNYSKPVRGISIQRSYDSSKGFTSIFSVPNPRLPVNGFLDESTYYPKMFYRLFITFDSGVYIFTAAKQPEIDANFDYLKVVKQALKEKGVSTNPEPRISLLSNYIYTGKDNNIIINLPDFKPDKYVVKIFDENDELLFELKKLTEGYLIVDKANFLHGGWFHFEIYNEGELMEKNKFNIPRD